MATFFEMAATDIIQACTPPAHIPDALLDEARRQTQGSPPQPGKVLHTCLAPALGPFCFGLSHPSVDIMLHRVIADVQSGHAAVRAHSQNVWVVHSLSHSLTRTRTHFLFVQSWQHFNVDDNALVGGRRSRFIFSIFLCQRGARKMPGRSRQQAGGRPAKRKGMFPPGGNAPRSWAYKTTATHLVFVRDCFTQVLGLGARQFSSWSPDAFPSSSARTQV